MYIEDEVEVNWLEHVVHVTHVHVQGGQTSCFFEVSRQLCTFSDTAATHLKASKFATNVAMDILRSTS